MFHPQNFDPGTFECSRPYNPPLVWTGLNVGKWVEVSFEYNIFMYYTSTIAFIKLWAGSQLRVSKVYLTYLRQYNSHRPILVSKALVEKWLPSGGYRLLRTGVQITSLVTTVWYTCKAIHYKMWHHQEKNLINHIEVRLTRYWQNFSGNW